MLVIGQSLECWRPPLATAVARRAAAPLLARARRQLADGAHALDVNFGAQPRDGLAEDLVWAAATLRAAWPDVPLFLDCGDLDALTAAVGATSGPAVANAIPLDGAPTAEVLRLLEATAAMSAGAVFSPRAADHEDGASAILVAAEEARALAASAGIDGPLYLDCLAYPPAFDPERCRRSLAWLRALHLGGDLAVRPLVAAGNVGHGAPAGMRGYVEAIYVVLAIAAGADALVLRAEATLLMSLVAGYDESTTGRERLRALGACRRDLPATAQHNSPPPDGEARAAWDLLVG